MLDPKDFILLENMERFTSDSTKTDYLAEYSKPQLTEEFYIIDTLCIKISVLR